MLNSMKLFELENKSVPRTIRHDGRGLTGGSCLRICWNERA